MTDTPPKEFEEKVNVAMDYICKALEDIDMRLNRLERYEMMFNNIEKERSEKRIIV